MGALAHYLESDGIATTQISLIREHTEQIRPPRALWFPFELGRPLGVPDDPPFQLRVLTAALGLLDAPEGPVLEDFPDEAPVTLPEKAEEAAVLACPVSPGGGMDDLTEEEKRQTALIREVAMLRPWYDRYLSERGQTAMVYFDSEDAAAFLSSYASGQSPQAGKKDIPLPAALRFAVQDLKAFYFEALSAQPGKIPPIGARFDQWFWKETAAGSMIRAAKNKCLADEDKKMKMSGMLLIPLGMD